RSDTRDGSCDDHERSIAGTASPRPDTRIRVARAAAALAYTDLTPTSRHAAQQLLRLARWLHAGEREHVAAAVVDAHRLGATADAQMTRDQPLVERVAGLVDRERALADRDRALELPGRDEPAYDAQHAVEEPLVQLLA